jgi:hypothetical protein
VYDPERRRLRIPQNWNVGTGLDWGTTVEHPTAIIPVARPNAGLPISDLFLTFGEVVLPAYPHDVNKEPEIVSPGRVAAAEHRHMKHWGVSERQVTVRRMSHEASAAKNSFALDLQDDLKLYYHKWKAVKGSGVPQWQNAMEIDYTKPHPFRRYPKSASQTRLKGR